MNGISKYVNSYHGRTVFIIGNGVEVKDLDPLLFKDQVTIGVNASHLFTPDMDFYIAGHAVFPLLWSEFAKPKNCNIFHGNPTNLSLPNTLVSLNNKIVAFKELKYFRGSITDASPLVGVDMCAFSATHLAFVIGAKRIVYIGFDLKLPYHFYDFPPYYETLRNQLSIIENKYDGVFFLSKEIGNFIRNHYPYTGEDLNLMFSLYERYKDRYGLLFNILRNNHIQVLATQKESIVVEAGATLVNLLDVL